MTKTTKNNGTLGNDKLPGVFCGGLCCKNLKDDINGMIILQE